MSVTGVNTGEYWGLADLKVVVGANESEILKLLKTIPKETDRI